MQDDDDVDDVDDDDDVDDLGKYCLVGQTPGEPKFSFRLWGNLLHHVSNIPRHGGHLMIFDIFKKSFRRQTGLVLECQF